MPRGSVSPTDATSRRQQPAPLRAVSESREMGVRPKFLMLNLIVPGTLVPGSLNDIPVMLYRAQ